MTLDAKDIAPPARDPDSELSAWQEEADRLKKLWIIATVFFLFSAFFQGALFVLQGSLNIVLLCVVGGMMVLGTALKFRYQRFLRTKPNTS